MKIFVSHYRHYDFENELYKPLRESALNKKYDFILPHENNVYEKTKEQIKSARLVIAEVSQSTSGVGIELGWADAFGVPIVCIHKAGTKPSNSLKFLTIDFLEYDSAQTMIRKLTDYISTRV